MCGYFSFIAELLFFLVGVIFSFMCGIADAFLSFRIFFLHAGCFSIIMSGTFFHVQCHEVFDEPVPVTGKT